MHVDIEVDASGLDHSAKVELLRERFVQAVAEQIGRIQPLALAANRRVSASTEGCRMADPGP